MITNQLLYQLSYAGLMKRFISDSENNCNNFFYFF